MAQASETQTPLSALMVENPSPDGREWNARFQAVLNDPPMSPEVEAKLRHELAHPKAKVRALTLETTCGVALKFLKDGLQDRSKRVRSMASAELRRLREELASLPEVPA